MRIDGIRKVYEKNTKPRQDVNVRVYNGGDKYNPPADAVIRNLYACTSKFSVAIATKQLVLIFKDLL